MIPPVVEQLVDGPISCHAWNGDKTKIAISPNNEQVQIYSNSNGKWTLTHTLSEHDKLVTGIDWAPKTNRIVTCSQDRNAYVWSFDQATNTWKPSLVLLRINRAATCVSWSPLENKFAVGSGARCISVCYFEEDKDWWVSKHLKKPIRSTILSINWHKNNVLIAAASADMKARVFSAFIKGVDEKPDPTVWGEKLPFNTVCADYSLSSGWIHGIAFSPSGDSLAWVSHDSSLHIVSPKDDHNEAVKTTFLPFTSLLWISENALIAAGHDGFLFVYAKKDKKWQLVDKLEGTMKKSPANSTALNRFKLMDSKAQESADAEPDTVHTNSIRTLSVYEAKNGRVVKLSSTGIDGRLAIWDISLLAIDNLGLN